MGWKTGFEPATPGITIRCSNQLSYIHHIQQLTTYRSGAPDRTRTCNRRLRRPVLYPVELRALGPGLSHPARRQITDPASEVVGVEGFEPPTLWSQTRCATRLRYTPTRVPHCRAGQQGRVLSEPAPRLSNDPGHVACPRHRHAISSTHVDACPNRRSKR